MAINKLRYFAAAVETRNLRKAAEIVGITPGSMSKAIATLEAELGAKLIRPEGRGIEITDTGFSVYNKSALILSEYRRLQESLKSNVVSNDPQLRIGTFEIFSTYFLSSFLVSEFSDHEILALELAPGKMESALLDNVIDFAITYLPAPDSRLQFTEIGTFELAIFGKNHWLKENFENWPFASPTTPVHVQSSEYSSLDMWPQNLQRKIKYRFEMLETALQTSRLGKSVVYCPDFVIHLQNRYFEKEYKLQRLDHPILKRKSDRFKVFLISRKDNHKSFVERKLAKYFRSIK